MDYINMKTTLILLGLATHFYGYAADDIFPENFDPKIVMEEANASYFKDIEEIQRAPKKLTPEEIDEVMEQIELEFWSIGGFGKMSDQDKKIIKAHLHVGQVDEAACFVQHRIDEMRELSLSSKVCDVMPLYDTGKKIDALLSFNDFVEMFDNEQKFAIQSLLSYLKQLKEKTDTKPTVKQKKHIAALFSGPPGLGKTLLPQLIAQEAGWECNVIKASELVNSYQGSGAENIHGLFSRALEENNRRKPQLLLFDEIDRLCGLDEDKSERRAAITALWQELDDYLARATSVPLFVVFSTNSPELLDQRLKDRCSASYSLQYAVPNYSVCSQLLTKIAHNYRIEIPFFTKQWYALFLKGMSLRALESFIDAACQYENATYGAMRSKKGKNVLHSESFSYAYKKVIQHYQASQGVMAWCKNTLVPEAGFIVRGAIAGMIGHMAYRIIDDYYRK